LSEININQLKDAQKRLYDAKLTMWNARLDTLGNDPKALAELLRTEGRQMMADNGGNCNPGCNSGNCVAGCGGGSGGGSGS
jgi:hypothetical protein